jgi:murein DD-endopeptidase MepM/ murein hydrolase activator NlpD
MRAIIPTELEHRNCDEWGCGHFGAPRGNRTHKGVDFKCPYGAHVQSPCSGRVTKLGYAYSDDLSFRYVEITADDGNRHRIFYVLPRVFDSSIVKEGDVIGYAQDLEQRYPGITPHVHYEIIDTDGNFIDPEKYDGQN